MPRLASQAISACLVNSLCLNWYLINFYRRFMKKISLSKDFDFLVPNLSTLLIYEGWCISDVPSFNQNCV